LSAKEMVIVFLGRIHVKKRLDLLADAFTEVCARRGGAHLVVAGPDEGGHRREVEPRFASVGERVHWTGELDENAKWALLAEANALVMCSATENFGMSVVEALAAGVPVVVTQTCPWEEIEPAGCGFWVPPTAEAIAAALLHLGDDPAMAKEMGRRGRALAERRYAWESIAYAMGEYYRAALRVQQHRRGE
jgi:glycosyltransferase involved in cell wall biosynthesis